ADPGIGPHPVAHPSAHQLPSGEAEGLALQIPQSLVEPRQSRHVHRPAAIEAAAIGDMPEVLDREGVAAAEAVLQRLHRAVHGLGPAFEARLAPADRALVRFHPDEQPAGRHVESLDPRDLHGLSPLVTDPSRARWRRNRRPYCCAPPLRPTAPAHAGRRTWTAAPEARSGTRSRPEARSANPR